MAIGNSRASLNLNPVDLRRYFHELNEKIYDWIFLVVEKVFDNVCKMTPSVVRLFSL